KRDGVWQHAAMKADVPNEARRLGVVRPKGYYTMLSAAVLLILSGIFEVFSLTSPVAIFGAVRGGIVAVLVHVLDGRIFIARGAGIYKRQRWGYLAIVVGTAYYTLEKLIHILDRQARDAEITETLRTLEAYVSGASSYVDRNSLMLWDNLGQLLMLACW